MRKTWVSSVVAGLLVLAPIAAVAQSAGQHAEDRDEVALVQEEVPDEELDEELDDVQEVDTLELVDETETDDVGDDGGEDGEDPAGDSNDHGTRVSTTARCAPTGKLGIGGFANHGAFVRAVAKGETIEVPGAGTFDLSTAAGVEALCAWSATYEPPAEDPVEATSATEEAETGGRPDHAGPPADRGKPDHAGARSDGQGKGNGNGKGNGKGR